MKKIYSTTALAIFLAACGGGGGGSESQSAPKVINGSASKGIIQGGKVEAFEVLPDGKLSSVAVGSATTDQAGNYKISLNNNYLNGPIRVVVSGGNGAKMVCDIPSGCGNSTSFGQLVDISDNFKLSAVIPPFNGVSIDTHINALTDLADKIASSKGYSARNIQDSNDIIRQSFSLTKDITKTVAVDITKKEALDVSNDISSQRVSLISAAILSSLSKGDEEFFAEKFKAFAEKVGSDRGLVKNDDDATNIISVQDILFETDSVVNKSKLITKSTKLDSAQKQNSFALQDANNSQVNNSPQVITPTEGSVLSDTENAKNLFADIRQIAAAVADQRNGLSRFESSINSAFFTEQETIKGVINEGLSSLLADTQLASLAISAAAYEYQASVDGNTKIPESVEFLTPAGEKIIVTISNSSGRDPVFGINQQLNNNRRIILTAVVSDVNFQRSDADVSSGSSTKILGDASLKIDGFIANEVNSLSVKDSLIVFRGVNFTSEETFSNDGSFAYRLNDTLGVKSASCNINAQLKQLKSSKPVEFKGSIGFDVSDLISERDESFKDGRETKESFLSARSVKISLNGGFSKDGESLEASFDVKADSPEGLAFKRTTVTDFNQGSFSDSRAGETAENFVAVQASLIFKTIFNGVGPAQVSLSAKRESLNDGSAEVSVIFNGKAITIRASKIENQSRIVSIENQNNVRLEARIPNDGSWNGDVNSGGRKVGSIETTRDKIIVIRYEDGSFESIF